MNLVKNRARSDCAMHQTHGRHEFHSIDRIAKSFDSKGLNKLKGLSVFTNMHLDDYCNQFSPNDSVDKGQPLLCNQSLTWVRKVLHSLGHSFMFLLEE